MYIHQYVSRLSRRSKSRSTQTSPSPMSQLLISKALQESEPNDQIIFRQISESILNDKIKHKRRTNKIYKSSLNTKKLL